MEAEESKPVVGASQSSGGRMPMDAVWLLAIVGIYLALQLVILPALGVRT
jgi:hypothetical protein